MFTGFCILHVMIGYLVMKSHNTATDVYLREFVGKFVFTIFTLITHCTRDFSQYQVCCAY